MTSHVRIAALIACLLFVPMNALAEDNVIVVRSADLALNEPRDVVRLDRRVARAAEEACGPISSSDLVGMNRRGRCTRASVAAALPQRDRVVARAASR
jgi:UrcA family protein